MFIPSLLVTDDDAAFRRAVCEGFVRRGFHVTEARDGQEAIEVIRRTDVHIALVDVHMPRLGGLELIRKLYDDPKSPLYVLMSAQLDDAIRREAIAMRAYEVLDKPIPLNRLAQTVGAALAQRYGWRQP